MGYILLGAILLVFVAVFFVVMAMGTKKPRGRLQSGKPVEVTETAADEPTPGASRTASPEQVRNAEKRTPPS
ncbi:MAG TPA: hypothetical protein VK178_11715 [Opitutaceae bacterium]|nr:hypothetical protein [Opitutaceae bacterium]